MFKSIVLGSVVAVSSMFLAAPEASAGNPYCGPSHDAYFGYAPVVVNPYSVGRVGFGTPYIGPDRYGHGFGYGYPGYRSYRAPVSVGVGGYPYGFGANPYGYGYSNFRGYNNFGGYNSFSGYNSFRGGSSFSVFIGR